MAVAHRKDIIGLFAQHRVASNLLMLVMFLVGTLALMRLNTQFFPTFALDVITVRVAWTGASADDVERSITDPLEQELRTVDGLKNLTSTSANGIASITLEYHEGTDMGPALDLVKERVSLVRNLPSDAEEPEVSLVVRYEPVARILVSGPRNLEELRPLVYRMERELLDRGIAKVEISGLPEQEIAIQVPTVRLRELNLSLDDIATRVRDASQDLPAGTVGRDETARQLRSLDQRRSESGFADLPIVATEEGGLIRLGDIARIEKRPQDGQVSLAVEGRPAVVLRALRSETADSLESARILNEWLEETRHELPPDIHLEAFDESWQLIKQRIFLLVKNGLGGLVLVLAILFLFLNSRVAFWVAVGIPISFMATLAVLYAVGGSINMISLFALIMALGIIVDDAIVVGEDALAHYQFGEASLEAAEGGARRMLAPVMSSSLTTIAAFIPLMMVGGVIGNILFDIPLVIICVIAASLVESFLILPGHLRHAFRHIHHAEPGRARQRLDHLFNHFRDHHFRRLVGAAVEYRWTTLAGAAALLMLSIGLVAGGRVPFTFFPAVEANVITANASFASGTPDHRVEAFLAHLEQALYDTEQAFGEPLVVTAYSQHGSLVSQGGQPAQRGDQFGAVLVELVSSDARGVRNEAFIRAWEARVDTPPGLENLAIASRRTGPPGRDVEVRLMGGTPKQLKAASLEVQDALAAMEGVSAVEDDMPWGQEQLIYRLTPRGRAVGLSIEQVGRQLRAAFDGRIAQIYHQGNDEVEVRVVLPDEERNNLAILESLQITLPNGDALPLPAVVTLESRRSFEALRHAQAKRAAQVYGDVDKRVANENLVRAALEDGVLQEVQSRYGVDYTLEGRAADQRETLSDMATGGILALSLIYVILTWVFASWGWPLVIMATIPFALVGALTGHFLMGIDLTILSLFGLFGLSGIVVNDSIILISFYKRLRETEHMPVAEAIVEAACQRLRAVLLTSLTTIAGLTPLLFETSLQAQFLIPMAVSISFGLGFATVLVLLVIPALLSIHESAADVMGRTLRGPLTEGEG